MKIRIGHAWDTHRLVENRPLILGGIEVPYEKGLLGHSDADVVLHVIAEAMLGALALGDLGTLFPDTDPKIKGIDSKVILSHVHQIIMDNGFTIGNIDVTIYAEKPKMRPYIDSMRMSVSQQLNLDITQVSIKATTHEKMGFIGRGEAIAAEAVLLLMKLDEEVKL